MNFVQKRKKSDKQLYSKTHTQEKPFSRLLDVNSSSNETLSRLLDVPSSCWGEIVAVKFQRETICVGFIKRRTFHLDRDCD